MKVAVIGAGISGLTAALRLAEAGNDVQVLEASSRPGGRMWSVDGASATIEIGAHMLLDTFTRTSALVDQMGLGDSWFEVHGGPGGGTLHDHTLRSFSPKNAFDLLRYQGLSLPSRVRLLIAFMEAHRYRGELDFFDLSLGDDELDREDCDSFARRRLGDEATDYVIDCFIRTFHFHGAKKMSRKYFEALAALFLSSGQFQVCALRGHMRSLPSAIAARLPVRYDTRVRAVVPVAAGVSVCTDKDEIYDHVVIATPAESAWPMLPAPTEAQRDLLARAESSRTALCTFLVPSALAGDFEGIWVPFVESQIVSGLANDACLGEDHAGSCVFSVWLHEEAAEALWQHPDADILHTVASELTRLFPRYVGALRGLSVTRWPHALPIYGVGQVSRVAAFWEKGQGEGGIWLCGDYLNHPWVEGAIRCGEKVARMLDASSGVARA